MSTNWTLHPAARGLVEAQSMMDELIKLAHVDRPPARTIVDVLDLLRLSSRSVREALLDFAQ